MPAAKLLKAEPGVVPAEFIAVDDELTAPSREQIAELAYFYWEARGRKDDMSWEDWFRAENDLKRRGEL